MLVERRFRELDATHREAREERDRLHEEAARLDEERRAGAVLDATLRDTFVAAQRAVEDRRRAAEAEAEELVTSARSSAGEGRAALDAERARIEGELERLRQIEREFRTHARALVEETLSRLGGPPSVAAPAASRPPSPAAREPGPAVEAAEPIGEETAAVAAVAPEPVAEVARPAEHARGVTRPRSLVLSFGILAVGAAVAVGIWRIAAYQDAEPAAAAPAAADPAAADPEPVSPPADEGEATAPPAQPETSPPAETAPPATEPPAQEPATVATTPPAPAEALVVLRAVGGDSWVLVRRGSASGRLLFEGFLFEGESRRFEERRIWMRIGNPSTLAVRLDGAAVRNLPPGTANVVVTPDGLRTVSLG